MECLERTHYVIRKCGWLGRRSPQTTVGARYRVVISVIAARRHERPSRTWLEVLQRADSFVHLVPKPDDNCRGQLRLVPPPGQSRRDRLRDFYRRFLGRWPMEL